MTLAAMIVRGTRHTELRTAVTAAASVAALAALFLIDPGKCEALPPCIFHALTGLYCPGCGSSRAMHQLLHGNVAAAFGYNQLMVLALPFIGYALAAQAVFALTGRSLPAPRRRAGCVWALLAVIIAYWVLRNVPVYPFSLLSPHCR